MWLFTPFEDLFNFDSKIIMSNVDKPGFGGWLRFSRSYLRNYFNILMKNGRIIEEEKSSSSKVLIKFMSLEAHSLTEIKDFIYKKIRDERACNIMYEEVDKLATMVQNAEGHLHFERPLWGYACTFKPYKALLTESPIVVAETFIPKAVNNWEENPILNHRYLLLW